MHGDKSNTEISIASNRSYMSHDCHLPSQIFHICLIVPLKYRYMITFPQETHLKRTQKGGRIVLKKEDGNEKHSAAT